MPRKTTIGQVLVNEELPPELRNYDRSLLGKELDELLETVGREYPDKYKDITHKFMQLGRETAFREGTTLSVSDLDAPESRKEVLAHVELQEKKIRRDKTLTPTEKQEALTGVYQMAQQLIVDQTYKKALQTKNPLALQVLSKARGNPMQLAAMLSTPSMFADAKGRTIPVFVRRSYSEGLKPWEYYAATFGARQAVISTKFATRDAGDLGKQMNIASEGLMITENDCGTVNGIPVDIDDKDNVGTVLARSVGGFEMGTPVTSKLSKELKGQGIKKLLVRSPTVCQSRNGLCKLCVGLREDGKFPALKDAIGVKASSALAERLAQGALNVKHCISLNEKVLRDDWKETPIGEVKAGDRIIGADELGNLFPVVVKTVFDNGNRDVWRTTFGLPNQGTGEITIDSTQCHKVWGTVSEQDCKGPRMLPVGTRSVKFQVFRLLYSVCTFRKRTARTHLNRLKQEFLGVLPTVDLEVDHPAHRFVLASGLVVSNSGGQKLKGGGQTYAGFDIINQMAQVPTAFRYAAAVSNMDGTVDRVEPAPQGGTNIYVGDELFYVDPEQSATVKVGDEVEAGDQLSTGIMNPAEVVKYKGIGEGRRYFAERMTKAFNDSKVEANRRNVEILSRGLINYVQIDEPEGLGDYLPGDIASYSGLAYGYKPRANSQVVAVNKGLGQYLEQPVLQHTIGTRVTKGMLNEFKDFGVDNIRVHPDAPAFTPQMTRLQTVSQHGDDWMAKLHGTYLKGNLLSDVQSGAESNIHGAHPIPALAYGVEFGKTRPGKVTY